MPQKYKIKYHEGGPMDSLEGAREQIQRGKTMQIYMSMTEMPREMTTDTPSTETTKTTKKYKGGKMGQWS
jgi:hypothetical protein